MNIDDRLRQSSDRLHSELEKVVVPSPPDRPRRHLSTVVVSIAVVASVVGATALLVGGGDREVGTATTLPDATITSPIGPRPFGMWELVELDDQPPAGPAVMTLGVEPDQAHVVNSTEGSGLNLHHMEGSAGCNRFSGAFGMEGRRLTAASMSVTLSECLDQELRQEEEVVFSLLRSATWEVTADQLILVGDGGVVAVFESVGTNSVVGVWVLDDLNGVLPDSLATLTFWPDSRLSGYAGCWISGEYETDDTRVGVDGTVTTPDLEPFPPELRCENLNALEESVIELVDGASGDATKDKLTLQSGALVATFVRAGTTGSFAWEETQVSPSG